MRETIPPGRQQCLVSGDDDRRREEPGCEQGIDGRRIAAQVAFDKGNAGCLETGPRPGAVGTAILREERERFDAGGHACPPFSLPRDSRISVIGSPTAPDI
ncbi:MAG TPA: hypothetical protein VFX03_00290 [Thermomicrobiales bacterium]|nr:hypothetical protein [Thermomicrobiales bacterium]